MSIREWPQNERPREKLLQKSAQHLSDAELLAIFLRSGTKGKTALDVARQALESCGNLAQLLDQKLTQFTRLPGLGPCHYATLKAAMEIGRRYQYTHLKSQNVLEKPQALHELLINNLRGLPYEVFTCLFLDQSLRLLGFKQISQGTINMTAVYPREVIKAALEYNSKSLILAHNHPAGSAEPSTQDIEMTEILAKALAYVEIDVLDHLIIGDHEVISMRALKLIDTH